MTWCGKTMFAWHLVKFLKCLFELSVLQQCHLLLIWCRPLFWKISLLSLKMRIPLPGVSDTMWHIECWFGWVSCAMRIIQLLPSSQSYKCIKSPDFVEGGVVAMAEAEAKCSTLGKATLKSGTDKLDKLEDAPASLVCEAEQNCIIQFGADIHLAPCKR